MKVYLLPLTSIMLCAATLHSLAQSKQGSEFHAAVTDMPSTIDMSYADPKTWHNLPPAALRPAHSSERQEFAVLREVRAWGETRSE